MISHIAIYMSFASVPFSQQHTETAITSLFCQQQLYRNADNERTRNACDFIRIHTGWRHKRKRVQQVGNPKSWELANGSGQTRTAWNGIVRNCLDSIGLPLHPLAKPVTLQVVHVASRCNFVQLWKWKSASISLHRLGWKENPRRGSAKKEPK